MTKQTRRNVAINEQLHKQLLVLKEQTGINVNRLVQDGIIYILKKYSQPEDKK